MEKFLQYGKKSRFVSYCGKIQNFVENLVSRLTFCMNIVVDILKNNKNPFKNVLFAGRVEFLTFVLKPAQKGSLGLPKN
jgi:hypothetical protein